MRNSMYDNDDNNEDSYVIKPKTKPLWIRGLVIALIGAGIGATIGTLIFPVIGTGVGAFIGATFGESAWIFSLGFLELTQSTGYRSRETMLINRITAGLTSTISSGAIGALVGMFIFPGVGALIGAAIGGGIGSLIMGVMGCATHSSRVPPNQEEQKSVKTEYAPPSTPSRLATFQTITRASDELPRRYVNSFGEIVGPFEDDSDMDLYRTRYQEEQKSVNPENVSASTPSTFKTLIPASDESPRRDANPFGAQDDSSKDGSDTNCYKP